MDQDPIMENEKDFTKRAEDKDTDVEAGLEKLERPPHGDFVAGLRSFIEWVKDLVAKD